MDAPTLDTLRSVAGATVLTSALMYVLVRAAAMTDATQARFGPLLAVGIGVAVTLFAVALGVVDPGRADVGQAIVNGILAGLASIGFTAVGVAGKAVLRQP